MDLMPDHRVWTVAAPSGRQVLLDPRQHRTHVVRRLLASGISAPTLRAIVPEWSGDISRIDAELHDRGARIVHVG
ncbi:MAG: hypothetical protein ACNA8R_01475 [Nitriliruptoraceae bacterium]